jgi:hypothetical protein
MPDTSVVVDQWQRSERGANHFNCVFLVDAKGMPAADVCALRYGLGDRRRRVTRRGQGRTFDGHESPYRQAPEAQGRWAICPVDCADPVKVATFINYVIGYLAKDDNQMPQVKPIAKARTLTMGRRKPEVQPSNSQMDGGIRTGSPAVPAKPTRLSI